MAGERNPGAGSRARLLEAAADLVAACPGQDVALRAICDRAGVRLPTLYHFFGSKEGLLGAVVEHGFDLYFGAKSAAEASGDPVADLRAGWDAHVAFGLSNPGFYVLMYGQVTPGRASAAQARPTAMLLGLTRAAAGQGRLVVSPEQAAAHVLAANVGVTLRQVVLAAPDPELSAAVREATIAAITGVAARGTTGAVEEPGGVADLARRLLHRLPAAPAQLGAPETALLRKWLLDLSGGPGTV